MFPELLGNSVTPGLSNSFILSVLIQGAFFDTTNSTLFNIYNIRLEIVLHLYSLVGIRPSDK